MTIIFFLWLYTAVLDLTSSMIILNETKSEGTKKLLKSLQSTIRNVKNLTMIIIYVFLISIFRCALNAVFFRLGDSPASEFYVPTFRYTLSVSSS